MDISQIPDRFTLWGGYSFNSVKLLGKTRNSQTQILAFGYQRPLRFHTNNTLLWYTADFIPYLEFHYPKRDEGNRMVNRSGFGLSPVGFMFNKYSENRFSPFFQATGGFIYMQDYFPTDRSKRFNYTFDIALGLNLKLNHSFILSTGYKFHHISNAETGIENPGLDSNFFFITISTQ